MAAPRPASYAQTSPPVVAAAEGESAPVGSPADAEREAGHDATVVERGAFARAVCTTCGWRGPGRRARAVAVADIEEHQLLGGAPQTVDLRDHH